MTTHRCDFRLRDLLCNSTRSLPLPLLMAFWCLVPASAPLRAEEAPRPNVLVILTDDIGWGDFRCYNPQGRIPSPNVDRLAREGMRFTHAHSPAALCSPTRYAMLTGNYPWRGREAAGVWGFNVPSAILPGQETVANLLKRGGYRTAFFGKSGIGGKHEVAANGGPDFTKPMTDGPRRWGFDYSFIIPRGHQAPPYLFLENERPTCAVSQLRSGMAAKKAQAGADYSEPGWTPSQVGERLLSAAEKFLDAKPAGDPSAGRAAPFYMHFCTDGAHAPYEPAHDLRGTPLQGATRMTAHTDMVHEADLLLGKLCELLERRGLLENTLIFLTSDNGGIPAERHLGHDAVGGLRGMKSNLFEGGHRVPFVARWPGRIPPGTVREQPIGAHDIVATVLELAGVAAPRDQCLDSVSLVPVLLGARDDARPVRSTLLIQSAPNRGPAFDGGIKGGPLTGQEKPRYLVAENSESAGKAGASQSKAKAKARTKAKTPPGASPTTVSGMPIASALYMGKWKLAVDDAGKPAALYDLALDPAEERNLLADPKHAARVQAMAEAWASLRASSRSALLSENRS